MIQKNTLPLMVVAIIAPTSKNAARPAKSWHDNHDANTISTNTSAPTILSPLARWPKMRQMPSYSSQKAARKPSAALMAAAGDQSIRLLSIRKVLALNRYSTVNRPKPVSQVE